MINKKIIFVFFVTIVIICSIFLYSKIENKKLEENNFTNTMKIEAGAFVNEGQIPKKYTCDGEDIFPGLKFSNIPQNTRSLVLIIDDPDAALPGGWDHYIGWNISPDTKEIEEGLLPKATNGLNSWGENGYKGPCPPAEHRYYFKIFALDILLDIPEKTSKQELLKQIKDHIMDEAEMWAKYKRNK